MSDLKRKAQEVANAGRFGDSVLIHVAPEELRGLASLMPDGKLTTNPKTGLPEAFFFLPFLAGLGAAAAPAAAAAIPAAAATGLAAAAPAAAGLAATGAGTLGAGMAAGANAAATGLAGLGATGGAAGLTAAAAPTALTATGTAAGGIGSLAAPAAASALPTATGAAGVGAGAGATGAAGIGTAGQAGAALAGPASFANPAGASAAGLAGAFPAAPGAVTTGSSGGLGGLFGGMDAGKMLQYGALASMMLPQGGGGGGKKDGGSKKLSGQNYDRGEQAEAPNEGADGGTTGEFNYFPRARYYAGGGLVRGYAEGGKVESSHFSGKTSGDSVTVLRRDMSPERQKMLSEMMGKEMAKKTMRDIEGEVASNRMNDHYAPKMKASYPQKYAEGGLASLAPAAAPAGDDGQLIDATVAALQGQVPDPDPIIQQFIQVFGPEALQDLIAKVQGGGGEPQGDGMSDSVPASVSGPGGSEPAALSEGEFVVPADVVSGLGNGSTDAGAQQLQGMMDRTRQMRGGGVVQPPAINPRAAMPM